jgi:hypothetical protein
MIVVAGPPGSGKSSRSPLSGFGVECFNADNRAAELNSGSFRKISNEIRAQVKVEFERWILDHITARKSFALEITPRSPIAFEQSRLARERGFWTSMDYVTAGSVEESIQRISESLNALIAVDDYSSSATAFSSSCCCGFSCPPLRIAAAVAKIFCADFSGILAPPNQF